MMILGSMGGLGVCIASVANQASDSAALLAQAESVAEQREEAHSSLVDCLQQENDVECSTRAAQYVALDEELLQQESTPAYRDARSEENQWSLRMYGPGAGSLLLLFGGYFAHEKRKREEIGQQTEQEVQRRNNQFEMAISKTIDERLERIKEQNRIYNPQEISAYLDVLEGNLLEQYDGNFKEVLKEIELAKNSVVSRVFHEGRKTVQQVIAEKKRGLYN